jgi:hypothetical protein
MNNTRIVRTLVAAALLVSAIGFVSLAALAGTQKGQKDFTIGNKGEIHFNVPVKAGDTLLQPGMYQLQHVVEGNDHVVIFKTMEMPAGYRHGNTPVSKDITARVKCKVVAADKINKTSITLRTNAAGEKEIAEVQVAGEAFKHLL